MVSLLKVLLQRTRCSFILRVQTQRNYFLFFIISTLKNLHHPLYKALNRGFSLFFIFIFFSGSSYLCAMDGGADDFRWRIVRKSREILNQAEKAEMYLSRAKSRRLLSYIKFGQSQEKPKILESISEETITQLSRQYSEKKRELEKERWNGRPANEPFYIMILEKYPIIFPENKFTLKNFEALGLNLGTLLVFDLTQIIAQHVELSSSLEIEGSRASLPRELVTDLFALFRETNASYPRYWDERIFDWIYKGLDGQSLTIFSPVCPDYSCEEIDGSLRYTFNSLGSGIGMVAQSILNVLPQFLRFCAKHQLWVKACIGMADFEALEPENCDRLEIARELFFERVEDSRKAIAGRVGRSVKVVMCTSLYGGKYHWQKMKVDYEERFSKGDFGESALNHERLLAILKKRKSLYERWYGVRDSLEEYLPQLYSQGAQCAGVATIASNLSNCLILGADDQAMAPFYDVVQAFPVLYIKSNY